MAIDNELPTAPRGNAASSEGSKDVQGAVNPVAKPPEGQAPESGTQQTHRSTTPSPPAFPSPENGAPSSHPVAATESGSENSPDKPTPCGGNGEALAALSWYRLRVSLVSIRNQPSASAHPLSIFQAIIKGVTTSCAAAPGPSEVSSIANPLASAPNPVAKNTTSAATAPIAAQATTPIVFFHLRDRKPSYRIKETDRLELEVLFCRCGEDYVHHWRETLQAYLADPLTGKNFAIVAIGAVEARSLAAVTAEIGVLPPSGELCLEFLSPLAFNPVKNRHRTFLTTRQFVALGEKRWQKLFGVEIPYPEPPTDDFMVLPYFWNYTEIRHPSRSLPGHTQYINGCTGRLYLKGCWEGLLPFLLLGAELHTGLDVTSGRGYYRLLPQSPGYFCQFFPNKRALLSVIHDVLEKYDNALETLSAQETLPFNEERLAAELCLAIATESYTPAPNTAFLIQKKSGSTRLVEHLGFRDLIVQRYLQQILSESLERMFEECSIGFRRGVSRERAITLVKEALADGYKYVIESDVEDFFPSVDLNLLARVLDEALPAGDSCLKATLKKCLNTGYILNGAYQERGHGLAQGSPLSPLLANLYLDSFDEEAKRWDVRLIRYADDFIILVRSLEEAEAALLRTANFLSFLGLRIKREKTAIKHYREGFSFLGITFGGALEAQLDPQIKVQSEMESGARALKKPLYVTEPYVFLALADEALEVRKEKQLIESIPLRRISEIMVMEKTVFSTALIAQCVTQGIPFTIALNSGYYITTIKPDSKRYYETSALHAQKYAALGEAEILCIAKEFAATKIKNYVTMFKRKRPPRENTALNELLFYTKRIYGAATREQVRGFEAAAAKVTFRLMNEEIATAGFHLLRRERKKPDAINSLLNFGYYLLFSRINAMVRSVGLNPYLGFLHSPEDSYESLVCDIQELFRARIDRLIIRTVNWKFITLDDFNVGERGCFLKRDAVKKLLREFEAEMERKTVKSTLSMKEGIYAQVMQVKKWAVADGSLMFYEWTP